MDRSLNYFIAEIKKKTQDHPLPSDPKQIKRHCIVTQDCSQRLNLSSSQVQIYNLIFHIPVVPLI